MRTARIVGGVGRVLIGVGLLLLLFVGYQLVGTNLQESRSQRSLRNDFERVLKHTSAAPTTATTEVPLPPPTGEAVAVLEIPKIGVHKTIVEGVGVADLKKAPGHYPSTPMPGQAGNAAIAGHRTTYGAPFYRLDELKPGDEIRVRTLQGSFDYAVEKTLVVSPSQTEVLLPTDTPHLTLTTCDPRFSARHRLVVSAVLRDDPAPSPTTTSTTASRHASSSGRDAQPVLEQAGLSGDPTARWPTVWWGLATALVGLLTWLASRRWRAFWAYVGGAPVFFLLLFVFFENVSRLLPANV